MTKEKSLQTALADLSMAMGNPALDWSGYESLDAALVAEAARRLIDRPWMLTPPLLADVRDVRSHLATVGTQSLADVDAEAVDHAIELLQRIENTATTTSDDRLRNVRAWAAARVGSLSGADVIVGAIDELLQMREDWKTICDAADAMPPDAP